MKNSFVICFDASLTLNIISRMKGGSVNWENHVSHSTGWSSIHSLSSCFIFSLIPIFQSVSRFWFIHSVKCYISSYFITLTVRERPLVHPSCRRATGSPDSNAPLTDTRVPLRLLDRDPRRRMTETIKKSFFFSIYKSLDYAMTHDVAVDGASIS